MKPEISVIIPNLNGRKYLKTCLNSLKNQSFESFETILIDNGSQDGSVELVKTNFPEVEIIALKENTGFSKAVNIGIKNAKGNFVVLLNNDTEAYSDWLQELNSAAIRFPQYWFFASKIFCFNKRDIIDSAGDGLQINGVSYRRGHLQKDSQEFNRVQEVFGPCGAAAFYKKELFDKIGLFDEDFFAFYEDVDLSFRAQLAGFKCLYVPSAIIYHIGHGTFQEINSMVAYLHRRNELFTLIKNMPFWFMIRYFRKIFWFRICWVFKDLIKMTTKYKYDEAVKIRLKARLAVLKGFIKMYKKRRVIQKNRRVSFKYLESILFTNP